MQALALAALLAMAPGQHVTGTTTITGNVTYYGSGIMERVYANRLAWRQVQPCGDCVGYAAMLDAAHLGRRIYVTLRGATVGPLLVIDCGDPRHRPQQLAAGLVAELDYRTARGIGLRGPEPGRVEVGE